MANYSSFDAQFRACLARPEIDKPGQPRWGVLSLNSPCIPPPSSFNPYKVTELADFKIEYLTEIISNVYFGRILGVCFNAAYLLPQTVPAVERVVANPQQLNFAVLTFRELARVAFPAPLNETGPPLLVSWWWNSTINDHNATSDFLNAISVQCVEAFCSSIRGIGDPDISGPGMLGSTAMLIVLAIVFAVPSTFGWHRRGTASNSQPAPKGNRIRGALVGTLDDLLGAIVIFDLSVLIAAIILRFQNLDIFDIFMAETLSLISSTAMVMIAAAYLESHSQVDRVRLTVLLGLAADALLTIVLFVVEFRWANEPQYQGIPIEKKCLRTSLGNNPTENLGGKKWVLPICFALWLVSLLAALVHLPWLQMKKPKGRLPGAIAYCVGLIPMTFGAVIIVLLCVMFFQTYSNMKDVYGAAFTNGVGGWGFGQYLALATWVPPILQFLHLLLCGLRRVLRTRLPHPWEAFLSGIPMDTKEKQHSTPTERMESAA